MQLFPHIHAPYGPTDPPAVAIQAISIIYFKIYKSILGGISTIRSRVSYIEVLNVMVGVF
jgi:hypothetical protein